MTESALPDPIQVARQILRGFEAYRRQFRTITRGARVRFEAADWEAVQQASTRRIKLYRAATDETLREMQENLGNRLVEVDWREVRRAYERLVKPLMDADLAETVYNTLYRKIHGGKGLGDDVAFVARPAARGEFDAPLTRSYGPDPQLDQLLRQVFHDYAFAVPFQDLSQDISLIRQTMQNSIPLLRGNPQVRIELLQSVFYRNKGAYLVGRMWIDDHLFPIAIPIQHDGESLYVDTIIWNENDLSVIFSFTRSYFMVDVDYPYGLVRYLSELLPRKKTWELYTGVGFYKHGKTEFYRGFLEHLEASTDDFVIAEGTRGMVMTVFTLPSYQTVFKIIKDRFSPTKNVTREQVINAYYLVKTHDRVGRMADTQEFHNMVFPRNRFAPELVEELEKVAAGSVTVTADTVTVKHLYTERQMTPLNLYVQGKSEFELRRVLEDCGNCIKQLASANIFPGDMLMKNFGVTRHGRVVFYDYDEICYVTDVNFRAIPKSRYPEDNMAAVPWYSVGPVDVFPEEFRSFLFASPELRAMFCEYHEDIFTADYWIGVQEDIRRQRVIDVFPYSSTRRFRRQQTQEV